MEVMGRALLHKRLSVLLAVLAVLVVSADAATPAVMKMPTPGSAFTSTRVVFSWSSGSSIVSYHLYVGPGLGKWNYYDASTGKATSASVSSLPSNGSTLYVKLTSKTTSGSYIYKQYTYRAYTQPQPAPATMNSPIPGGTLTGTSVAFTWTTGRGVSQYSLAIGSSQGATDIFNGNEGTSTSTTASGLPQDGRALYVRLGSLISGTWRYNQYTYTAKGATVSNCGAMGLGQEANLNGFRAFPAANAWNQDVSSSPVDPNSAAIINYIGGTRGLHPDFGSGILDGSTIGIPYIVVDSSQAKTGVTVTSYPDESDITWMPIPASAPIEGYPLPGDNHVLVLDRSSCWLYELGGAAYNNGQWSAAVSAVWDLQNYNKRPYTWTSADAAGLPIFPGLVRYDEVAAGAINHAIRFTLPQTRDAIVSPATHWAGNSSSSPIPMGMRLRLKAGFDVSSFSHENQAILNAIKKYGLILADNGSAMYISGTPDNRWNNDDLHALDRVTASNFEVVQMPPEITPSNVPSGSAPFISSLNASSMSVAAGTPVTLTWTAIGVSYYYIDPQVGPVRGNSAVVSPRATTTYTLNATNSFGRNTASITITVQ